MAESLNLVLLRFYISLLKLICFPTTFNLHRGFLNTKLFHELNLAAKYWLGGTFNVPRNLGIWPFYQIFHPRSFRVKTYLHLSDLPVVQGFLDPKLVIQISLPPSMVLAITPNFQPDASLKLALCD